MWFCKEMFVWFISCVNFPWGNVVGGRFGCLISQLSYCSCCTEALWSRFEPAGFMTGWYLMLVKVLLPVLFVWIQTNVQDFFTVVNKWLDKIVQINLRSLALFKPSSYLEMLDLQCGQGKFFYIILTDTELQTDHLTLTFLDCWT